MLNEEAKYMVSCLKSIFLGSHTRCPYCDANESRTIQSNYGGLVRLRECNGCMLRFRVPAEDMSFNKEFYQSEYSSGITTDLPDSQQIKKMIDVRFKGTGKDFTHRIDVLKHLGVEPGAKILDFGASWGYATWQLKEAGYSAIGYEVSRPRAEFGSRELGVEILSEPDDVPDNFDVMFSSHVVEHLPTPRIALDLAQRVLKPGGILIQFTPNGSNEHFQRSAESYNLGWHRVHPLYLSAQFYLNSIPDKRKLLMSVPYEDPYPSDALADWAAGKDSDHALDQSELLLAVRW